MSVLLISPQCEHPRYPLYFPSENLGIGYIASFLRSRNIAVDIFDANMLDIPYDKILNHIDLSKYTLVGISSSSFLLINEAFRIAESIKKQNGGIHITIGGHFATFAHEEILKSSQHINSVVRGEGEHTVYELIYCLENEVPLSQVAGLSFKINNSITVNPGRPLISNLDLLPWPARDTLPYLKTLGHSWPTQLTTSRGCYANCSFCDIRAFSGTLWRGRNEIDIVDEMEYLATTFGSNVFRFTDDEFIGPKPHGPIRARKIAEEILRRGLKIEMMIDARAHMVDKELFEILAKAGVNDCLIGIESGIERILKLYNKGISVATNSKAISILRDIGIKLNLAFIMFDPRMTFDELKRNYEFLEEHKITTADSLKSWIWPLDGTPLRKTLINEGFVEIISFDEFRYNFADNDVQKIFTSIEKCTQVTFSLEREFYRIKKYSLLPQSDINALNSMNLQMWKSIFEILLNNPDEDVEDFAKSNSENILTLVSTFLQAQTKY